MKRIPNSMAKIALREAQIATDGLLDTWSVVVSSYKKGGNRDWAERCEEIGKQIDKLSVAIDKRCQAEERPVEPVESWLRQ